MPDFVPVRSSGPEVLEGLGGVASVLCVIQSESCCSKESRILLCLAPCGERPTRFRAAGEGHLSGAIVGAPRIPVGGSRLLLRDEFEVGLAQHDFQRAALVATEQKSCER